jgi:3-oxoacyl-[acyl-carrier protein] reductase
MTGPCAAAGDRVLVAGASRGSGLAIAAAFARQGAARRSARASPPPRPMRPRNCPATATRCGR